MAPPRKGIPLRSGFFNSLKFILLLLALRQTQDKIEGLSTDYCKNFLNSSTGFSIDLVAEIENRIYWPKVAHLVVSFFRDLTLTRSKKFQFEIPYRFLYVYIFLYDFYMYIYQLNFSLVSVI